MFWLLSAQVTFNLWQKIKTTDIRMQQLTTDDQTYWNKWKTMFRFFNLKEKKGLSDVNTEINSFVFLITHYKQLASTLVKIFSL